ncbi:SpoVR family protein [Sphingobium herbicidovorans NBRC 16415]|uniref:SpoVR family protein n=1 Tax=Sphingobium herbicidovorans (strain ATCC 700291 / DSM 11019 / CCUG 56400 / KCTC 2939 / LMG 18315 / NBRC 16415 / MH) TaxID=1219045 RepID=A0A086PC68_SPHHM|nr:SpoVR family protein [Sphingobium herbicidovorans]KFG90986.1 SpoVR family protein [Sphingobium herbicidovorans NBRC 16415]
MTGALAPAPLFTGSDWDFSLINRIYETVEPIALQEMKLNIYPNQIEIISAEQMLDAYSSIGMPLFYKHWSFGKQFVTNEMLYRKGLRGLAYELVINSDPCINYLMQENSATMQTLVIAHAAFGHNHFFKNNYVFKQWTDAEGILDYLEFAKRYIAQCEERHGQLAVERVLDAAHALMNQGVHRYPRVRPRDMKEEAEREAERQAYRDRIYDDLWRTVPVGAKAASVPSDQRRAALGLPQENILYFLEKTGPRLESWQREILRIVRLIAQYFYPQRQTKAMNEGCATYTHYRIMTILHDRGWLTDGAFMEFIQSHTNVVYQPTFDSGHFGGFNPYALGFGIMSDIERICMDPTDEDRDWFGDIAGARDPVEVLKDIWANYRDESFVSQFLSPHLIRQWRLFQLLDRESEPDLRVEAIHDERGYRRIRRALAREHDIARQEPDIQVVDVDLAGDRTLMLEHAVTDGVVLDASDAAMVLQSLANLWGYEVALSEVDVESRKELKNHRCHPQPEWIG